MKRFIPFFFFFILLAQSVFSYDWHENFPTSSFGNDTGQVFVNYNGGKTTKCNYNWNNSVAEGSSCVNWVPSNFTETFNLTGTHTWYWNWHRIATTLGSNNANISNSTGFTANGLKENFQASLGSNNFVAAKYTFDSPVTFTNDTLFNFYCTKDNWGNAQPIMFEFVQENNNSKGFTLLVAGSGLYSELPRNMWVQVTVKGTST